MIGNIELLNISIENKEPYIDPYYVKNSDVIITHGNDTLNELMQANTDMLDNISAYHIAVEANNIAMQETILKNIIVALDTIGINFSEFTSYRAIKDVSYSVYRSICKTQDAKMNFLRDMIPAFIKDRHMLYKSHGYSFTTLQAVRDSKAHKGNGNAGNRKVTKLFEDFGLNHFTSSDLTAFTKADNVFIYPDKTDKVLFQKILSHYNIDFERSKNHENKQTDFLFKIKGRICIMEHKHMKESGGGQDKQMSEIIDFIGYDDKNISYISFLDGVYFNLLADTSIEKGKTFQQRKSIINNLNSYKQNYFVNTHGFITLLANLME